MNYKLTLSEQLEDINSIGHVYIHKSGAKVIVIENNDEDRVFSISFRTLPKNSKGIAHIVEHCVLCGSKGYNIKDPFNTLDKGSIHTYLNAMTYADKTIYPIGSTNEKDFKAMMRVYLDAVFNPLMHEDKGIFLQEAWHSDGDKLNGVVLNEMKGVYSEASVKLEEALNSELFKNTPYEYDSGGNPEFIPELSYEEFLDYHKENYHPSNAVIYLYGKLDVNEYFSILDEFIDEFSYEEREFSVEFEAKECQDIEVRRPSKRGNMLSALFFTGKIGNFAESLLVDMLCDLLFNTEGAFIAKRLRKLGDKVSASHIDSAYLTSFSVDIEGSTEQDINTFKKELNEAFKNVEIDRNKLQGIINGYKFYLKEEDFGYKPKGLYYCTVLLRSFMYGNMTFEPIKINELFEAVNKVDIKELINRYFVDKGCYGILIDGQSEPVQRAVPPKNNDELIKYQSQVDNNDEINKINVSSVSEIPKEVPRINFEGDTNLFVPVDNGDVVYIDAIFDANHLTYRELSALGLLQVIASVYNIEYSDAIDYYVGGFDMVLSSISNEKIHKPSLFVRIKALKENIYKAIDLLYKVMTIEYKDKDRVEELLKEKKQNLQNIYIYHGNAKAYIKALSVLFEEFNYAEASTGYGLYEYIFNTPLEEIVEDFNKVSKKIFRQNAIKYSITCSNKDHAKVSSYVDNMIDMLGSREYDKVSIGLADEYSISIESNVNFNAIAFPIKCNNGIFRVAQQIITNEYLWDNIRLQGGAYGGKCQFGAGNNCCMYSFRDPKLAKSYDVFLNAGNYLTRLKTQKEIDRFILGTINLIDKPIKNSALNSIALRKSVLNITHEKEKKRREEILGVVPKDMVKVGEEINKGIINNAKCSVGKEADIKANLALLKAYKQV